MTTFVSQHVATPTVSARPVVRSLTALGTWVGDRTRAYRAAADLHRDSVDPLSVKLFARD
jgi:hypothetical protein